MGLDPATVAKAKQCAESSFPVLLVHVLVDYYIARGGQWVSADIAALSLAGIRF